MDNALIADRLDAFASLLELSDANPYTVRAYRRAAETVRGAAVPVADLVRSGRVRDLRGIGPGIEARLRELVETGSIAELEELERELAPDLVGLGRYLGLTARRSIEIARALDIRTAEELREAAAAGRLRSVPGVGPKTEASLLEALAREDEPRPRRGLLLNRARATLLERDLPTSARRASRPATSAASATPASTSRSSAQPPSPARCSSASPELPQIVALIERDERRAVGRDRRGRPGRARRRRAGRASAPRSSAPPARPSTSLRSSRCRIGPDEHAVYDALGIPWCPPELRERPFRGEPPALLELADIRGDLHSHTTWSDGRASVEEMGRAARERGYEYLAICDHTPAVGAVTGLTPDDVRRQAEEIAAANEVLAPFRVLRGIECDILPDGRLDLPDDVLAELDWVQASVHGGQRMPRREMTARVEAALRNPHVSCLSHPKGRYIGRRPENELDLERAFEVALEEGVAFEVNGLPDRLDLSGDHVREALEAGLEIVCNTDSHSVRGLGNMELAVATARRGWATAEQVVNTRPLSRIVARRPG